MFPYHDENETRRTPFVTYAIIAANVLVWLGIAFVLGKMFRERSGGEA